MGFNSAKSEATSVFLKHPSLVLVGSVSLYLTFGYTAQKNDKVETVAGRAIQCQQ